MKISLKTFGRSAALGTTALCLMSGAAAAQQVFTTDVVIDGSLCVGIDCASGESFGSDTIRLKENNLRIHFDDTSSSASFPANDWRLVANDQTNGGANYFAIEDSTVGRIPFRVEAGAIANALYVDNEGDVGIGTASPVVEVHAVDGNSPTYRLEQDGSAGFQAQTWDIAGNETNFFVRNVTNGSDLPFRIFPDAGDDALVLRNDRVGVNTDNPTTTMDIRSSSSDTTNVRISDSSGSGTAQLLTLENNGGAQLFLNNTTRTDAQWLFSAGRSLILASSDSTADRQFELENNGNLEIQGTLTESSDKNRKMAIEPVNPTEILAKVRDMPVAEWTYIHDAEEGIRHIGPMAQDFYAAFGTGASDTGISTLDSSGVALAAIQALSAENAALQARLDAIESQLAQD
ncbi:tail fiber domain-containing protein [uncultured Tateyamaria sp.]|uniref:tail fiber domain-containing protein n=1 Tax=uncultured Tateyamaria sp. TaxID=455651 RepID=UPI002615346B|nr:tail fiber domain-containing protein [uncultured Tateyamaria sp.]